jgi:outer membrane immunogenic protein
MRRLFIGSCVALICAHSATAADLEPMPFSPPAAPAGFTWNGFYVGGHAAWARQGSTWDDPFPPFLFDGPEVRSFTVNAGLGGAQAGWDRQFGNLVVGGEVDFSLGGATGSRTDTALTTFDVFFGPFLFGTVTYADTRTITTRMDWAGTATARIGYAWGNLLPYVKAGAAVGRFDYGILETERGTASRGNILVGVLPPFAMNASDTRLGWTAGAGLEWAVWERLSAMLEYDYLAFPGRTVPMSDATGFFTASPEIRHRIQMIKLGLNWRIGGP